MVRGARSGRTFALPGGREGRANPEDWNPIVLVVANRKSPHSV